MSTVNSGVYPVFDNKFKIGIKGKASTEEDMKTIARLIKMTITDFDTKADEIRAAVNEICSKYPLYE